jgi:hypothetical protein
MHYKPGDIYTRGTQRNVKDQSRNIKCSKLVPKQPVSQKVELIATFAKHKPKQRYFIRSKWSNEDVGIQVV